MVVPYDQVQEWHTFNPLQVFVAAVVLVNCLDLFKFVLLVVIGSSIAFDNSLYCCFV